MKILITGVKGQLGNELLSIVKSGQAEIGPLEKAKEYEVVSYDVDKLDISDLNKVREILNLEKPNVVINCAACTNVDGCESNEELAFKVNSLGPRNLAMISEEIDAKLVQVSTDYVFSGEEREVPFREYDLTSPYSVYGKTKLMGEEFVKQYSKKAFIVRTSWLYGYVGHNFVYTMRRLGSEKEFLTVVNDQKGNPTHANDLAYHILKLIETEEYGIYHCTGKGECTWYDFAKKIMELSKLNCDVRPCTSEEFKTPAKRPEYSSLDNMMLRCTIGDEMRNWEEAIESFIKKLK
ncbi:dTDP-4-dehydrorhamnose reductase [Clostridium thermobutyricum]|uniref:dTDP-4-dehydrorhamnose reductase n=1 Tax=Clostridium thermobutyricum TaxID=29372 RepID=UPI0018AAE851|nr:dTDP-4-dehydrorhamnose reductase [Clostridium thermobutyricum]